ncbi:MAG TPA: sulfatase/phosphatase domain-containing protein, partial [Phycisphaerae bacterium]|nr:sulfatase/phosphatase domain-containing protein [Phycisphaerae bacterium]
KQWAEMYDPDQMVLPGNFDVQRDDWPMAMVLQRRQPEAEKMTVADHRKATALYYGLTSQIDHNIGRVLTELDRLKLADRTLVIYTADHGELLAEHRCWTKTVSNYDATTRVPMILRLPGRIPAGAVRDELVGLVDIAPTVLELSGQKAPEKVQGKSMAPLLTGEKAPWRRTVFSEIGYPGKHHGRCVMARTHKHKYIHNPNLRAGKPLEELFDLALDPWETTNRAGDPAYADVLARLKGEIADWDKTTDHAPMYPIANVGKKPQPRTRPAAG